MIGLNEIKADMLAMEGLHNIVDVLKGVSSAQLRAYQNRKRDTNYNRYLEDFFRILNLQHVIHPFLKESSAPVAAIVAITSDESFTGEMNSSVVKKTFDIYSKKDKLIVLGQRGMSLFRAREVSFEHYNETLEKIFFLPLSKNLVKSLTRRYLENEINQVDFIYPCFVSLTKQEAVRFKVLPFHPGKVIKGTEALPEGTIIEPSLYRVADILVRLWMFNKIYDILWEANLAFTAARILQLEGSSQELEKVQSKLRLQYFKLSHTISDKGIREIFSSRIKKSR